MKLIISTIVAVTVVATIPAFAAPQDACWRAAQRVTPRLTEPEKEQYIVNCLADWTAGTPPPKGKKSYNRNKY